MTEIKIGNPIESLSNAVRVLKAAKAKQEKAQTAESDARKLVTELKASMQSALDEDRISEISRINTKLKQANNAVDRAIDRSSAIDDEYAQAINDADRAVSALKGGAE